MNCPDWPEVMAGARRAMEKANEALVLDNNNRRGPYRSVSAGITLGPGSKVRVHVQHFA